MVVTRPTWYADCIWPAPHMCLVVVGSPCRHRKSLCCHLLDVDMSFHHCPGQTITPNFRMHGASHPLRCASMCPHTMNATYSACTIAHVPLALVVPHTWPMGPCMPIAYCLCMIPQDQSAPSHHDALWWVHVSIRAKALHKSPQEPLTVRANCDNCYMHPVPGSSSWCLHARPAHHGTSLTRPDGRRPGGSTLPLCKATARTEAHHAAPPLDDQA